MLNVNLTLCIFHHSEKKKEEARVITKRTDIKHVSCKQVGGWEQWNEKIFKNQKKTKKGGKAQRQAQLNTVLFKKHV